MGRRAWGRAGTRSLRRPGGAAHSEGAAADAILAEHPSRIGTGKVLPKSTTDDDGIDGLAPARRSHQRCRDRSETHSYLSAAGEQSLGHLDMTGHSDMRVRLQRFAG